MPTLEIEIVVWVVEGLKLGCPSFPPRLFQHVFHILQLNFLLSLPPQHSPYYPITVWNRGTNNQKFCGFNWIWAMPQNRFTRVEKGREMWRGKPARLERVEFAFEQSWGNKINCNQVKRHSTWHEGQPDRRGLDLKPDYKLNWDEAGWNGEMGMGGGIGFHYWMQADSTEL